MIGREDGENAVKQGEGFMFKQMKQYDSDSSLKAEYRELADYIEDVVEGQYRYYKKLRREQTIGDEDLEPIPPKQVDNPDEE